MIDWANLAANALWILGCAIALATLSYASWEASTLSEKMSARLKRPSYQTALYLAFLLISVGLAATSDTIFTRIVWGLMAILSLVLLISSAFQAHKSHPSPPVPPSNQ